MNEYEKQLLNKFDAASRKVKEVKPAENDAENSYALTYQALVKAGLAPQIRKKYR